MKTCPNCNASNNDDFAFCEKCGTPLNNEQNAGTQSASYDTEGNTTTASASTPPKKFSPAIIALVCVAVVAAFFLVSNLFSNPTYKLLKGLSGLSKMDKITAVTTVDFEYDGRNDELEILNNVTLKANVGADIKNLLAETSLELLYDGKFVAKAMVGVNNKEIYAELEKLYGKVFYQDLEDIVPDYADNVEGVKTLIKALDQVKLDFNKKKYANIIKEVLDDDIKSKGNKVILTLDSKNTVKLVQEIFEEAAEDEKLMKSARKSAENVIKQLLKDKKKIKDFIDPEDLEDALEAIKDEDDFEDLYFDAMDEALWELEYALDRSYSDDYFEVEITFTFGMFNKIKSISYSIEMEDDYSNDDFAFDINIDIKKGAKFTKVNKNKAIEIQKLLRDDDELEEVGEEVIGNLIKVIKNNKKLTKDIEDITGEDIEDLEDSILDNLMYMFW